MGLWEIGNAKANFIKALKNSDDNKIEEEYEKLVKEVGTEEAENIKKK